MTPGVRHDMKRNATTLRIGVLLAILLAIPIVGAWPSLRVMILRRQLVAAGLPADALRRNGKGIVSLTLRGTNVIRLPNLSGARIYDLRVQDTSVRDLSPLRYAILSEVSLKGSPVNDLSPLTKTGVRFIDLLATGVTNLSPLAKMTRLEAVRVPGQQVLRHLTLLKSLHIFVHTETDNSDGGYGWYRKYERMNDTPDAEHGAG
jgi:hypothetical protein